MTLKTALTTAAALLATAAAAERGSDGPLTILYWQAPSILNPYLSGGYKDVEPASLVIEPLAGFDQDGVLYPRLAAAIPTVANGGISADLTAMTWTLRPGLLWSDGTPVTAADVKFTADYCMAPDGGCAQGAKFHGITGVEVVDDLTVRVTFAGPTPYPYAAFVGNQSPILQQAQFKDCLGPRAPECTEANFGPVGTGPFRVTEFRTGDVLQLEANPHYRDPSKPAFATVTLKGGGDAAGAARAVLQTGEVDYAWNLAVSPEVLDDMLKGGKGEVVSGFGTLVERIEVNLTDPSPALPDGERSTALHPHPILSDVRVRKALSMAIDRQVLVDIGLGKSGRPTCNIVPAPALYASTNTDCLTQDLDGARALLEAAGWTDSDGDGIRDKDGRKLSLLFATSTNAVRQDFQTLIKQWWGEIGIETELKNTAPSVFFGGDVGSPDTFQKFYADVEMYAAKIEGTDPQALLSGYTCDQAPRPETGWQGVNINRYCDPEYDRLVAELARTADPEARGALARRMNDMLTRDSATIIPLIDRGRNSGKALSLGGVVLNTWDSELWNVADWYRIK
jgi:peptide/nickel transport system substrate-binding protein